MPANKCIRSNAVGKSLMLSEKAMWPITKTRTVVVLHIFPLVCMVSLCILTFFSSSFCFHFISKLLEVNVTV